MKTPTSAFHDRFTPAKQKLPFINMGQLWSLLSKLIPCKCAMCVICKVRVVCTLRDDVTLVTWPSLTVSFRVFRLGKRNLLHNNKRPFHSKFHNIYLSHILCYFTLWYAQQFFSFLGENSQMFEAADTRRVSTNAFSFLDHLCMLWADYLFKHMQSNKR